MPLIVKSSFEEGDKGTLICEEDANMEQPVVSGIMCDKNQAKITLKEVPDQPGIAANIFEPLAKASISVDMIIQNVSEQGHTDLSFTLQREELDEAMVIMNKVAKKFMPPRSVPMPKSLKFPLLEQACAVTREWRRKFLKPCRPIKLTYL